MEIDLDKIQLMHHAIDNQMPVMEARIDGLANKIMFRRVHAGMMHAIIDMAVEHQLKPDDIETAIGSAIANMVNSYVTGTVNKLDIEVARETVLGIMNDAWQGVAYLVDLSFVREATDADAIH